MAAVDVFEVLSPGLLTTVQDLGRFGYARHGVAPSGALDSFSLRVANLLAGNPEGHAGLETVLMGLRIRALTDVVVAITGADLQPQRNKIPMEMWRSRQLKKNDILSFSGPRHGCRAYIAVQGGIDVPQIMDSRSTNLSSGFGGFEGRPLKSCDVVKASSGAPLPAQAGRIFHSDSIPRYRTRWSLRVIWGPQDDHFTDVSRATFVNSRFNVLPASDRTGIRLQGERIEHKTDVGESIISEGVISGAIQIPADGQPIILLGETVSGGYRKIATVISADLPLLGQIKPGEEILFQPVSLNEAHESLSAIEGTIQKLKSTLPIQP
jgi:antagonist of KipI